MEAVVIPRERLLNLWRRLAQIECCGCSSCSQRSRAAWVTALAEAPSPQLKGYDDDPHGATGRFDFVLANPPFNLNAVDKERLKDMVGANRRFPVGLPRTGHSN